MPDWHDQLPSSPALEINLDERALIIKAMEIVQAREASRREMTISWVPTLAHIKTGEPITLADFIIFQGSLMTAQQIRNDGHDTTPEENADQRSAASALQGSSSDHGIKMKRILALLLSARRAVGACAGAVCLLHAGVRAGDGSTAAAGLSDCDFYAWPNRSRSINWWARSRW